MGCGANNQTKENAAVASTISVFMRNNPETQTIYIRKHSLSQQIADRFVRDLGAKEISMLLQSPQYVLTEISLCILFHVNPGNRE